MTGSLACFALASGCLDFGSLSGSDAGSDDSAADSTPVDAPDESSPIGDAGDGGCDPSKPFGSPVLLGGGLPSIGLLDARLSDDELTAYFSGDGGVFVATRSDRQSPFQTASLVSGLSPKAYNAWPSDDQLTVFFAADNYYLPDSGFFFDGGAPGVLVGTQILSGDRSSTSDPFGDFKSAFAQFSIYGNNRTPFYVALTRELWFSTDRSGGGDIDRALQLNAGGFDFPSGVPELATPFSEILPALTGDGKTIGFSTMRTDGDVKGGYDIWTAQRPTIYSSFNAPTPETTLNTSGDEDMVSFSADGCRIYYLSEQSMFVASRPN